MSEKGNKDRKERTDSRPVKQDPYTCKVGCDAESEMQEMQRSEGTKQRQPDTVDCCCGFGIRKSGDKWRWRAGGAVENGNGKGQGGGKGILRGTWRGWIRYCR